MISKQSQYGKAIRRYLAILVFFCIALATAQSDITGYWKTFDDDTGAAISVVKIYKKNSFFYGEVAEILTEADRDKPCIYCKGIAHNQPILGLTILKKLQKNEKVYDQGTILDPKNGKVYRCKLWLDETDPNILHVRGYISFLYRTQQWLRVEQ